MKALALLPVLLATALHAQPSTTCVQLRANQQILFDRNGHGAPQNDSPIDQNSDTARLQSALDACTPGHTVQLSRSSEARTAFVTGPLHIPAGVRFHIDAGVTLFASRNADDYLGSPALMRTEPGASITGHGSIDGRNRAALLNTAPGHKQSWSDLLPAQRPVMIHAFGSLTLQDVTLWDAPGDNLLFFPEQTGTLTADNLKIVSDASGGRGLIITGERAILSLGNSSISTAGQELTLPPDLSSSITNVGLYHQRCLLNGDVCVDQALPNLLRELYLADNGTLQATLTPVYLESVAPAGAISFYDGSTLLGASSVWGNFAELTLPPLAPGNHLLSASQPGKLRFGAVQLAVPDAVRSKLQTHTSTSLTTPVTHQPFGTAFALTAVLTPRTATGTITFTEAASILGLSSVNTGSAAYTSSVFPVGTHSVVASYSGDAVNAPSSSPPLFFVVETISSSLQLSALPANSLYGALPALTATIAPLTASGNITFTDAFTAPSQSTSVTQTLGVASLNAGSVSASLAGLAVGLHVLSATYAGDTNDQAATSPSVTTRINPQPTSTSLAPISTPAPFGDFVTLNALVSAATAATLTGMLTFADLQGAQLAQLPMGAAGSASFALATLSPGPHTLIATYSGDATHSGSSSVAQTITVKPRLSTVTLAPLPATIPAGSPVVLTATILPFTATGLILFEDGATGTLGSAPIVAGHAFLPFAAFTAGTHILRASYAGDPWNSPAVSSSVTISVNAVATQIVLTSNLASAASGEQVRLTATVQPASATGFVQLLERNQPVGTLLLTDGQAAFTCGKLLVGTHTLSASYAGDALNAPALSVPLPLDIRANPTRTTVTLAQSPLPFGSPANFNIRVTAPFSSPTGSVRVLSGTSVLASGVLTYSNSGEGAGTLTADVVALGVGSIPLTVVYAGDANDLPSTGSASLTVNPVPVLTLLTLSPSQTFLGTAVTATAHLSATALGAQPTGSIVFSNGATPFATVMLDASATAAASLPVLPIGSYQITAHYLPVGIFAAGADGTERLLVTPPVSLHLEPASLPLNANTRALSALTLTPLSGFTGPVTLTCVSPVSYMTCSVDAIPPLLSGTPVSTKVNITVALRIAAAGHPQSPDYLPMLAWALPLPLARRRRRRPTLWTIVLLAGTSLVTGCMPEGGNFEAIPTGTYVMTLAAQTSTYTARTYLAVIIKAAQ